MGQNVWTWGDWTLETTDKSRPGDCPGPTLEICSDGNYSTRIPPSEARSLAAALTAWADRVEPVKANGPTFLEFDGPSTPRNPLRQVDKLRVDDLAGVPGVVGVFNFFARNQSISLTAEQATRLAAFLTRKPAEPVKAAEAPEPTFAQELSRGLLGQPGHETSLRLAALEDAARRAWSVPTTVMDRLSSLEAARDALKDVLTVQARHDESILDLSARLNSLGAFPGRTGPASPVPNPLLEAAIANAVEANRVADSTWGEGRCEARRDGVQCLMDGDDCRDGSDHSFPEGAEIRAGLVKALAGEDDEPTETLESRVTNVEVDLKAIERRVNSGEDVASRLRNLETGSRGMSASIADLSIRFDSLNREADSLMAQLTKRLADLEAMRVREALAIERLDKPPEPAAITALSDRIAAIERWFVATSDVDTKLAFSQITKNVKP